MDETYGTYVDDECFVIHDYDDDTDHDTGDDTDDDTDDDTNDDTDDDTILMMVGAGTSIQSRLKDQGPCPGTKKHPRRAMGVILTQSKAPIEIFNSRSIP